MYMYYRIITTVERDIRKYHEYIAGIFYECAARVNNTEPCELLQCINKIINVALNTTQIYAIVMAYKVSDILYLNKYRYVTENC